jgi:general secretion pathway protein D
MTFLNLSRNFDIRATIEALCQSKDAQLLADPSVMVVDREPAQIPIITEIPYQQLTQTQQGGNIGTTAFREAGVTLRVVPHISDNHTVQMEVTPSYSRLTGFTNGQSPQPIIDKREAKTTVRVVDQQWLVIGGLRQRTAVKDDRSIPGLGSMKHFGKLFQAFDYSFRESELVVFIMPEVVAPTYIGREREREILDRSNFLLEETPIAPHVLGQGEVGCPNCGGNCQHGQCKNRWKKPWNNNRNDLPMSEPEPGPYPQHQPYEGLPAPHEAPGPQGVPAPRGVPSPPAPSPPVNTSASAIRRLPRVEPSSSVTPPPPVRTAAQSTAPPPANAQPAKTQPKDVPSKTGLVLSAPQWVKKSLFGQPPLAATDAAAKDAAPAKKPSATESTRRTATFGNKATGSSSTASKPSEKKPAGTKTATSTSSSSWMPSWWR